MALNSACPVTILGLAGVYAPRQLRGASLVPLLRGNPGLAQQLLL